MAKTFLNLLSDYIIFVIVVIITTVVPLWSRFFGKKKTRTKADYVFAAGGVSVVSMMLSIARGTLGVRSFLGENFLMRILQFQALLSFKFILLNF
jgi:Na+(H+)/acetate symporter ActP